MATGLRRRRAMSPEEVKSLAERLKTAIEKAQVSDSTFARDAGVDQPMVWRARQALLVQWTDRVQKLDLYVRMVIGEAPDIPPEAMQAVGAYFAAGGRVDLLCEGVRVLRDAQIIAKPP
jgi:hypothetical protein